MTNPDPTKNESKWTVKDSAALYGLDRWGREYFRVNEYGNISVNPKGLKGESLDLTNLLNELKGRNLNPPILLRFDDILEDRINKLHHAFDHAIKKYNYKI